MNFSTVLSLLRTNIILLSFFIIFFLLMISLVYQRCRNKYDIFYVSIKKI
nr:MAG TPA: protein of unknown function (DUF5585) [Caudoviricetes sp.]